MRDALSPIRQHITISDERSTVPPFSLPSQPIILSPTYYY